MYARTFQVAQISKKKQDKILTLAVLAFIMTFLILTDSLIYMFLAKFIKLYFLFGEI